MAWPVYAGVAGLQILNGLNQASLIRQQAAINKQVADMNVELARIDQFDAIADGMSQTARYQGVIDTVTAAQEARFAAAGVDSSYGTAGDISRESKLNGFLNTIDIQNAAYSKAAGFEKEIQNINLQSRMAEQQAAINANATTQTAIIQGATTMLSGYSKMNTPSSPNTAPTIDTPQLQQVEIGASAVTPQADPLLGRLGFQGSF